MTDVTVSDTPFRRIRHRCFPARGYLHPVAAGIVLALCAGHQARAADEMVQFNTDVLDVKDRARVDLSQFSREGYLMPGEYQFVLRVNKSELPSRTVVFMAPDDDPRGSEACLSRETVPLLGLKENALRGLTWWHQGQCLDTGSLPGMTVRPDLGSGSLYLSVPQAYLEYTSESWDPPSRWDNGVPGILFDYSLNAMNSRDSTGKQTQNVGGNGTVGVNMGPWRMRANWQSQYDHTTGESGSTRRDWSWNQFYLYRPVTSLKAKLTLGESYLSSSMFDSFRFTGASLTTDDNQLPPNLRGYAPEVSGLAKTNARVTVSQQGRVLYETTVAAGPFRIQDLSEAVSGKLDVKVQEQDGSVHTFQVDTANIPYLTRPGLVRYKVSAGKPSDYDHHSQGPEFATGEFSWGINNGWSLYGGGLFAGDYNALALGVGRDLLALGAISLDVTESRATGLPGQDTLQGGSYRVSYSKRFDEYDSQVTFAGYRFSERNFMSMSQYLDARRNHGTVSGNSKELYTVTLNKQFRALNLSTYLTYGHQTYWDREATNNWNLSVSDSFDMGHFKGVTLSLSAYRSQVNNKNDDAVYLSLTLPWDNGATISYNGQFSGGNSSHDARYYNRIDDNTDYSISAGTTSDGNGTGSGYFTHDGDIAQVSANASVQGSDYRALGLSLQGGMNATAHGEALHRTEMPGGTRLMVDTGGVSGVPVRGYGGVTKSNIFGKAVVTDISDYYRSSVSVDLDMLPDDVEATRSVVQDTLTEGAIGYRKFGILAGRKGMAVIKLADGSAPPFGASVARDETQTGLVGDGGSVWLSGMTPGGEMAVSWDGKAQCYVHLPSPLPEGQGRILLLPCTTADGDNPAPSSAPRATGTDTLMNAAGLSYGALNEQAGAVATTE